MSKASIHNLVLKLFRLNPSVNVEKPNYFYTNDQLVYWYQRATGTYLLPLEIWYIFVKLVETLLNLSWKFLFLGLLWLFTTMKLIENLTHFSNNTSIHGLVHIAKKSSSKAKRITWFVIFILSMIYAGTQIAEEAKCKHLYLLIYLRDHPYIM